MTYVPGDGALGNPGFFGFIGKAVSAIGKVAGTALKTVAGGGTVQVAPPQVIVQSAPPQLQLGQGMPSWVLPAAILGGALLLGVTMNRRRR